MYVYTLINMYNYTSPNKYGIYLINDDYKIVMYDQKIDNYIEMIYDKSIISKTTFTCYSDLLNMFNLNNGFFKSDVDIDEFKENMVYLDKSTQYFKKYSSYKTTKLNIPVLDTTKSQTINIGTEEPHVTKPMFRRFIPRTTEYSKTEPQTTESNTTKFDITKQQTTESNTTKFTDLFNNHYLNQLGGDTLINGISVKLETILTPAETWGDYHNIKPLHAETWGDYHNNLHNIKPLHAETVDKNFENYNHLKQRTQYETKTNSEITYNKLIEERNNPLSTQTVIMNIANAAEYQRVISLYNLDNIIHYGDSNYSFINPKSEYCILYNTQFNILHIIPKALYVEKYLPELVSVNATNINIDSDTFMKYRTELQNRIFIDIEDATNYINNNFLFKINNDNPTIEGIIIFINTTYNITDNIEDKILFTDIFNIIINHFNISDVIYKQYVKNKLPYILQDMKLQKKRYSKGIYWYGLQHK
jgi:hypothetical protein